MICQRLAEHSIYADLRYEYQYMRRKHRMLQKDGPECRVLIKFTDFSFSVLIFARASLDSKPYIFYRNYTINFFHKISYVRIIL